MPAVDIFRNNDDPYETAYGLRTDTSTRGVDLAGSGITARYLDGSVETLTWQALDPYTNGGVTGTDIDMFFGNSWHQLTTTKTLTSLSIDLKPAYTVFDTTFANDGDYLGGSTPGSKNGSPFELSPEFQSLAGSVSVTYSEVVNLVGRPADGDLYTTVLIDFSGLSSGGLLGYVEWRTDMDTLQFPNDLMLGTNFTLTPGVTETGSYGRNFNGTQDADGIVRAAFTGTGENHVLSLTGYDVDFADEIEVLLNGESLGYLGTTENNGTGTFQFDLLAADQIVGDNYIEFHNRSTHYNWGVTDLSIEPGMVIDFDLSPGVTETGSYGRNFNGTHDADGIVRAAFTGTGENHVLSLTGYDVDFADEIEVLLNGESLGYLGTTENNGTGTFQFDLLAADQIVGVNYIEFHNRSTHYNWGVTDLSIEPGMVIDFDLSPGVTETGSYGRNFNGTHDADGIVRAAFTGTGENQVLSLTGYDVDFADEIEVLLNGESLGYLGTTENNGTGTFQFDLLAADQIVGDNYIEFHNRSTHYNWGVTDLSIEPGMVVDFDLSPGVTETGSYGRNFNGTHDADGIVRAAFTGTGENQVLSLTGYDVDFADEIEVLLNGESLGYLGTTENNGTGTFQFDLLAADQVVGDNYIEFHDRNPHYNWGVTDLLIDDWTIA
ncbi:hypothetical protein OO012_06990 [Rhodobacteraceae bacterium KMM 6894]|nr:hypothetical protein [Rhodobacteraceae bacterium KMM 6894]